MHTIAFNLMKKQVSSSTSSSLVLLQAWQHQKTLGATAILLQCGEMMCDNIEKSMELGGSIKIKESLSMYLSFKRSLRCIRFTSLLKVEW